MNHCPSRKPFALANWKMAMMISESLAFVDAFCSIVGDLAGQVDVVICPPYTALYAVAQVVSDEAIQLGAQDLCAAPGKAHTGEISAPLLADVGCEWVLLGHWEIRRRTGETNDDINRKIHAVFQVGLRPILLVGEAADERGRAQTALVSKLPRLLAGCTPVQVSQMTIVYEPEWTIGVEAPATPEVVAGGCGVIRRWIGQEYGKDVAKNTRIIYGGSVSPAYAEDLLASPHVDGLGAGRKGRGPAAFARIVDLIAQSKGGDRMTDLTDVLDRYGKERELESGETLLRQGAVSDGVYYLKVGRLEVYREEGGQSYLLSIVAPEELVGELGTASGRARAATVRASQPSTVIHISETDFNRALDEAPELAAKIICTMGDWLINADMIRINLGQSYHRAASRVTSLSSEKVRLEELLRLREEMANMIVHDLRNPLGVIFSGLELLGKVTFAEGEKEYANSVLETMNRSVQRMQYLVDTLLDIARLEEHTLLLQPEPLVLSSLVEEVIIEERPLAERVRVTLDNRVPTDLPPALADRHVLQRVLINLLDNALKFTPGGGQVWITAHHRPEEEAVCVEVVDTGLGILSEERTRIFEKFTQVRSGSGSRRGSGLGLTFCQMAIEAQGGRIWVEDGPQGKGSCFVFTLPRATDPTD